MKFNHFIVSSIICVLASQGFCANPFVTSVSPSNGMISGGNVVTINGSGLTCAYEVDFGFRPSTTFTVVDDNSITAEVPPGTPGTLDVTVTSRGLTSSTSSADFYTYTAAAWEGIVSGSSPDEVGLFSTGTNTFDTTIPLSATSLSSVISPDGAWIYTADSSTPGITVIDASTNTIFTTVPTSVGTGAFDIIINPSGTKIYVSNNPEGYVTVFDTATNTVDTDIFVDYNLGALSITPDGSTVYVGNFTNGNITAIDTATNTVGTSISTGIVPGMTSITPDGTKAFVCNLFSDTISVVDLATQTVTNTIVSATGAGPYGSSVLPNGLKMYVANINDSTVSVIDVLTESSLTTISLPSGLGPFWLASTPDNATVYVINETNDEVTPIDVCSNTAGTPFGGIGGNLQDIVISADQSPTASFTATTESAGNPTSFDASASISPVGTIANYHWDFGDGNTASTASPMISHTYVSAGMYNATLTVTNSAGTSTEKVFSSRFMSRNGSALAASTQSVDVL